MLEPTVCTHKMLLFRILAFLVELDDADRWCDKLHARYGLIRMLVDVRTLIACDSALN